MDDQTPIEKSGLRFSFTMRDLICFLIVIGIAALLAIEHSRRVDVEKQNINLTKDLDTMMRVESMDSQEIRKLEEQLRAAKK